MENRASRYARQVLFSPIGKEGQAKLAAARVLIVGCGALGSASANLLARAGVGHLSLLDRDILSWSNLQRQLLYDEAQVEAGLPKAVAAVARLQQINSEISLREIVADITPQNIEKHLKDIDLVLDATDNFETRFLLNDACLKHRIPWIYGACVAGYGLMMNILPGTTPCLRCLFEEPPTPGTTPTCDTTGVLGPIVTTIASLQCTEALKLFTGHHDKLRPGVFHIDLWEGHSYTLSLTTPREGCPACQQQRWDYLSGQQHAQTSQLCGRNTVQISPASPQELDFTQLATQLATQGEVTQNAYLLRCRMPSLTLTLFRDGRALIEGTDDPSIARGIYAKMLGS